MNLQQQGNVFQQNIIDVPSSVNWYTMGDVNPVYNEGQCGAPYAFAAAGALGSVSAIFGTGLQSFSVQQLVDCTGAYGNFGCSGGYMDNCYEYVIDNGITTAFDYPYQGVQRACQKQGGAFKIKSYTDITKGNCNQLQAAVAQQPVSVGVDATNWQFYQSGIFSNCGTNLNHAALVVGYTPQYWILQNQWGVSWGVSGYIDLKLGNTCGVCDLASYPNLN